MIYAWKLLDHVQGLVEVTDAVCATQPQSVVEVAVDALGVVTTSVEPLEVTVAGWNRSDVLCPVELSFPVFIVAVEANCDGAGAVVCGETVIVVPTVSAGLGLGSVGADSFEWCEGHRHR